ncbi:MAG: murF [Acidobacteria bacterium]|nr:murF [Acidobacteriota bacterium]
MRYRFSDIPYLLKTPVGRSAIMSGIRHHSIPVLAPVAACYRMTLGARTRTVAVVGSFGKTTATRAAATALDLPFTSRGTSNALSAVALSILRTRPWQSHAMFEAGIDNLGQMAIFARMIRPDITVVTCIGSEHNRSLKSLEVTRAEKARMVAALPEKGLAVLNGDDPHVLWMRTQTRARVMTFGFGDGNDVRATDVELNWPGGTRFHLHICGERHPASVKLIGRHMIYPILAAAAVALAEGRPLGHALECLGRLDPTPCRMEPLALSNGAWLLNDSIKSSIETIHAALDVFEQIPAARRLAVMGEVFEPPGSQGPIYKEIGRRIAGMAKKVVILGGSFQPYATGARRAGMSPSDVMNAGRSVEKAAEMLTSVLRPGDVVLIKGRDSQRLERIALMLQGRTVRCSINHCRVRGLRCADCPMLGKEWGSKEAVT